MRENRRKAAFEAPTRTSGQRWLVGSTAVMKRHRALSVRGEPTNATNRCPQNPAHGCARRRPTRRKNPLPQPTSFEIPD